MRTKFTKTEIKKSEKFMSDHVVGKTIYQVIDNLLVKSEIDVSMFMVWLVSTRYNVPVRLITTGCDSSSFYFSIKPLDDAMEYIWLGLSGSFFAFMKNKKYAFPNEDKDFLASLDILMSYLISVISKVVKDELEDHKAFVEFAASRNNFKPVRKTQ